MTQDVFAQLTLPDAVNYQQARTNMLKQQIRTSDVVDEKILTLFYDIPREDFVPLKFKPLAFADMCIPLAHGQSMMTPREEGLVLQELHVRSDDKVLVLGPDTGYLITLLSKLAASVFYVDNNLDFFETVKGKINQYQLTNVTAIIGSFNQGWKDFYPYDVIVVTGSLPAIPDFLRQALTINGRLFVVVGYPPAMQATFVTRNSEDNWTERKLFEMERPRLPDVKESDSFVF